MEEEEMCSDNNYTVVEKINFKEMLNVAIDSIDENVYTNPKKRNPIKKT